MKKNYILLVIFIIILLIYVLTNNYINIKSIDLEGFLFNGKNITISGDYIFYQKSRNLGTDLVAKNLRTGKIRKITNRTASNIYINKNTVYYTAPWGFGVDERIFKRELQGLKEVKLNNDDVDEIKLDNDYLFYRKVAHSGDKDYTTCGNIYKINLQTNDAEIILPFKVSFYIVSNGYIFFYLDEGESVGDKLISGGIYKYSISDKTLEMVIDDMVHQFYLSNNNLFYSEIVNTENNEAICNLVQLNLDTNEYKIIDNSVLNFHICGKFICYVRTNELGLVNVINSLSGELKKIKVENLNPNKDFVFYHNNLFYYDTYNQFCQSD